MVAGLSSHQNEAQSMHTKKIRFPRMREERNVTGFSPNISDVRYSPPQRPQGFSQF